MIPVPAYDLPPISRALKFDDFDRLCVRLVTDKGGSIPPRWPSSGERVKSGSTPEKARRYGQGSRGPGDTGHFDYWTDGPTLLGGYEGEVAMTVTGAVPGIELEG